MQGFPSWILFSYLPYSIILLALLGILPQIAALSRLKHGSGTTAAKHNKKGRSSAKAPPMLISCALITSGES